MKRTSFRELFKETNVKRELKIIARKKAYQISGNKNLYNYLHLIENIRLS